MDVHTVSAHVSSASMCKVCHAVPSASSALPCMACHTFATGGGKDNGNGGKDNGNGGKDNGNGGKDNGK